MLAIVSILFCILAVLPQILSGDTDASAQAGQAVAIAQLLNVQYEAALNLCAAHPTWVECMTGVASDIDTSTVLPSTIVNSPLYRANLVAVRFDNSSNRIVAFVDENHAAKLKLGAMPWGQVGAALIAGSRGADGVGFWRGGHVISGAGTSAYTISKHQGTEPGGGTQPRDLSDNNPIIVQP